MPVRLWKEMMEHYFPNSAWIRLRRDAFEGLYDYKIREGLPTWEAAVEALLRTTLVSAERASQELKEQARKESELLLTEAHAEARAITRRAHAER